jgi:fructoselysine-6-P-deglycase FrlB-like protein
MSNAVMAEEIAAQPAVLGTALPKLRAALADLTPPTGRVIAGGCGDSLFAAGATAGAFAMTGLDYRSVSAMQLACYEPLRPTDLCILLSVSGGTRRTVEAAARARAQGCRVLAVTVKPESALARAADRILVLPYQPLSRTTPHSLDYSVSLLALAAIAERLSGRMDEALDRAAALAEQAVQGQATAIAQHGRPAPNWYFLGAGPGLDTAAYAAAKWHEAGGQRAMALELENAVHGANFMFEPGDRVVLVGTDAHARAQSLRLRDGLRRLGCRPCLIGAAGSGADLVLASDGWLAELEAAILAQRLCLAVTLAAGLDLEAPRAGRAAGELHLKVQRQWMA